MGRLFKNSFHYFKRTYGHCDLHILCLYSRQVNLHKSLLPCSLFLELAEDERMKTDLKGGSETILGKCLDWIFVLPRGSAENLRGGGCAAYFLVPPSSDYVLKRCLVAW
jgi:hypothetical protein